MNTQQALAYAKKALGVRYPFAVDVNALLPLTTAQADRAQVVIQPAQGGGLDMWVQDTQRRRRLVAGWWVVGLTAHERKHYTAELLRAAWAVLAQEAAQEVATLEAVSRA